jgi:hypothetical protein
MMLLCSIPGIGRKTAGMLLLFAGGFQRFDNYRQLIALACLSLREYSSGTSVRGKVRITKMRGNTGQNFPVQLSGEEKECGLPDALGAASGQRQERESGPDCRPRQAA